MKKYKEGKNYISCKFLFRSMDSVLTKIVAEKDEKAFCGPDQDEIVRYRFFKFLLQPAKFLTRPNDLFMAVIGRGS